MKDLTAPSPPTETLDLAIPDMNTEGAEEQVQIILQQLPAVVSARLVSRGAVVEYNPIGITKEEICTAIRQAGFRPSTFQDSKTGETGVSSQ
jgi:hypothetical protein